MKILLAADGSKFTKKALAFLAAHDSFMHDGNELSVIHVQAPLPPRVKTFTGADVVAQWHREEAERVLQPIERFLAKHTLPFKTRWVVGHAPDEIVKAAQRDKADVIVMGTHGHGVIGRALMGSVAQRVVTLSPVPVLLVK